VRGIRPLRLRPVGPPGWPADQEPRVAG